MSANPFSLRNIGLTLFFLLLTALAIGYILFQARFLIAGPEIILTNDPEIVQTDQVVMIEGATKNIVAITLNDRDIFTTEDGRFVEPLILENGYSIMTLRARDRYGREEVLKRPFVYSPAFVN